MNREMDQKMRGDTFDVQVSTSPSPIGESTGYTQLNSPSQSKYIKFPAPEIKRESMATLIRKFLLCLASILWLDYSIKRRIPASAGGSLTMFDQRYGYSQEEAVSLLTAWESKGRLFYLVICAIDSVGFIVAYRALLERLYSTYIINPTEINLSWAIVLLAYVDYIENAGQTSITIFFEYGYVNEPWFGSLVRFSSVANMVKWTIVKYGGFLIFALFIYQRISRLYSLAGLAIPIEKKDS